MQADVSDPCELAPLVEAAEGVFGIVDILVNDVGNMRLAPVTDTINL
jgi:3-oxoacyl-[acyl-carrier protein] reductase